MCPSTPELTRHMESWIYIYIYGNVSRIGVPKLNAPSPFFLTKKNELGAFPILRHSHIYLLIYLFKLPSMGRGTPSLHWLSCQGGCGDKAAHAAVQNCPNHQYQMQPPVSQSQTSSTCSGELHRCTLPARPTPNCWPVGCGGWIRYKYFPWQGSANEWDSF